MNDQDKKLVEELFAIHGASEVDGVPVKYPVYRNIPIQYLELVRKYCREKNFSFRICYRGPRNDPGDTRSYGLRQLGCLKRFARAFTVYCYPTK